MEDMATCWKVDYFEGGNKDALGGEDTTRRRCAAAAYPVR
jgi:hypothetical protein